MGRRTINTTKGGKFMNPTDQARKEARRRELKKNKRQRMAVRQAVIRTKDPQIMIKDLEELDEMELNPIASSPYNEKVVKEKRRKLLESLIRIVDFYCKEDPQKGRECKVMIEEYKLKRSQKELFSESVRNAQTVDIGAIPLPDTPFETPDLSDIPLPGVMPQSILKKPPGPPAGLPPTHSQVPLAPGHPPGLPPPKKVFISRDSPEFAKLIAAEPIAPVTSQDIDEDKEDDMEDIDDDFVQQQGLQAEDLEEDDDDDDEFHHRDDELDLDDFDNSDNEDVDGGMKRGRGVHFEDDEDDEEGGAGEEDNDENPSESSKNVTRLQAMMLKLAGQKMPKVPGGGGGPQEDGQNEAGASSMQAPPKTRRLEPPGPPPGLPPGPPPGMPPMMKTGMMPPGPPPGLPPGPPPGMPGGRMPSGPPPMMKQRNEHQQHHKQQKTNNTNVFSAPPSLINRSTDNDELKTQAVATISAKPQLTTVPRGEATRFLPTALRIKREVKPPNKSHSRLHQADTSFKPNYMEDKKSTSNKPSADVAYDTFMKEMKGLL